MYLFQWSVALCDGFLHHLLLEAHLAVKTGTEGLQEENRQNRAQDRFQPGSF
jgi:hypothetical protein